MVHMDCILWGVAQYIRAHCRGVMLLCVIFSEHCKPIATFMLISKMDFANSLFSGKL